MLLLSTASLKGYGLHKIFSFAASAGFDGICLDLDPTQFDTLNAGYIAELSAMYQLPIRSIAAYERKMDTETVDDVIAMARSLGAESVFFSPPHRLDRDASWFSTYLPQIAESVTDVNLAVINMEPKTILFFIPEYKDATLESIRKVTGKTALSISNVDPETGVDLMRTFTLLGNSIVNVFLWDRSGSKEELFPGRGDAPIESLLVKLREAGYNGDFTLKVAPKELGAWDDELVMKRLTEARAYFEKNR